MKVFTAFRESLNFQGVASVQKLHIDRVVPAFYAPYHYNKVKEY